MKTRDWIIGICMVCLFSGLLLNGATHAVNARAFNNWRTDYPLYSMDLARLNQAYPAGAGHPNQDGVVDTARGSVAAGRDEVLTNENVIVRLGSEVRLGSDLRRGAAGPALCSTPFWGHSTPAELIHRANRRVPLAAIYLLVHAPEFRLTPLAPAAVVMARLSAEKVATERAESAAAWLRVTEPLIDRTPIHRLEFHPTPELWDFLARAAPAGPRV